MFKAAFAMFCVIERAKGTWGMREGKKIGKESERDVEKERERGWERELVRVTCKMKKRKSDGKKE